MQDKTLRDVFIGLFAVSLAALLAVLVVMIVFFSRKAGRIACHMGVSRTEDSIKLGSTLVEHDTIEQDLAVKQKTQYPVILSMTTSPARLAKLHMILQLIHPGMYDEIHLNLPHKYKRTNESYNVPASVKTFPKLKVFEQPEDLGPAMKLLPTLQRTRHKAIVITLDDDTAYCTHTVALILDALRHYKYEAVVARSTFDGKVGDPILGQHKSVALRPGDRLGDIVEGYALVGYPNWLVDHESILSFSRLSKQCFQSDDLTISYALAQRRVPRIVVCSEGVAPALRALSYGLGSDALHVMQSHTNAYQKCAESIRESLQSKTGSEKEK